MNSSKIISSATSFQQHLREIPTDVPLAWPRESKLPEDQQHFLIFIPWEEKYLQFVPEDIRSLFDEVRPLLAARTTDVHTAICLQYVDEFLAKSEQQGRPARRNILMLALLLHDSGWSQMSELEIANSLGVSGLKLTETAMGPKEKHAVLGAETARKTLTPRQQELHLSDADLDLICRAILYHDKPEAVAGQGNEMPIEVQLLVDLDHVWSFTHLNFWQDVLRKGVEPPEYLKNLQKDLDGYFVTEIGKAKARELWSEREKEVHSLV